MFSLNSEESKAMTFNGRAGRKAGGAAAAGGIRRTGSQIERDEQAKLKTI
jgi:hypothetical protein